jgi:hypothetical protein
MDNSKKKRIYSMASVESFGSFKTEAGDAIASEFRRRLVFMKVSF